MNIEKRHIGIASVFLVWTLPRIVPLIMYPGVYSFDAWAHIGYVRAILEQNHIPPNNPYDFPYFTSPFLHLFAILLSQLTGLSLIHTFQLFATLLIILGFLAYFTLFRSIFGNDWLSIIAMLLFALSVDVILQTNAVIPENLALVIFALALLIIIKLVISGNNLFEWGVILSILLLALAFSHPLTTYFGILLSLSLIISSLVYPETEIRKRGSILGIFILISLFTLLSLASPLTISIFQRFTLLLTSGLILVSVIGICLYFTRKYIWVFMKKIHSNSIGRFFGVFGIIVGLLFFLAVLFWYPYERSLGWIIFKFGLFSFLLGLSLAFINRIPLIDRKPWFIGVLSISFALLVGLSFSYTAIRNILDVIASTPSLEMAFSHRHLAFLLIPLIIMSTVAFYKLNKTRRQTSSNFVKVATFSLVVIVLIFIFGGIYNIYSPIGGWYPEYCNQSEIQAGFWLNDITPDGSFSVTDKRLNWMLQGNYPAGTDRFRLFPLTNEMLSDPRIIFRDSRAELYPVYYLTSNLMDRYTVFDYLKQPEKTQASLVFDDSTSLAKIYTSGQANVYYLLK